MKGTVAPSSSSSTAAATWAGRAPSSVASWAMMRAGSTEETVGDARDIGSAEKCGKRRILPYPRAGPWGSAGIMIFMFDSNIADYFSEQGPLARALPGYRSRPAQVELAEAIGRAIRERGTLVAEAGTGIGKTWAYLVPAIVQ